MFKLLRRDSLARGVGRQRRGLIEAYRDPLFTSSCYASEWVNEFTRWYTKPAEAGLKRSAFQRTLDTRQGF